MKIKPVAIFGILTMLFFTPFSLRAASLYMDPSTATMNSGDSIKVAVRLDTDESIRECVNAVDAVIEYSGGIDPVDVSIGDSILSVWVESPKIDKENKRITFAGGVPNGYCGRIIGDPRLSNVLAEIVFRSPGFSIGGTEQSDEAVLSFSAQSAAYLNDGRGTNADLKTYGSSIKLVQKPGGQIINTWKDEVSADDLPPEEFTISLNKDDKAFSQKYYIVFNTTDKQTGIDHYEVIEEPLTHFAAFKWGRADAPWVTARSPYVLKDQSLNSIIRVRAVDKAGNEYVATHIPDESLKTISRPEIYNYITIAGLVVVGIVSILVALMFVRRRKDSNILEMETVLEEETD